MPTPRKKSTNEQASAAHQTRGGRKRTARDKLLTAAYNVMSRRGLDGSTIVEIIDQAGVGVGSFYNHFVSKEDLAKAVFSDRAEALGAELERVALTAGNVATATCFAFRRLIEEVESDQIWASFIVQLEPSMQMLDGLLRNHARVGIESGIARGMLALDDIEAGITAFHAVTIAIAKAMLEGALSTAQAHHASLFGLRMFGVPEAEAVRLSSLSMDALRRELHQPPHP